MQLLPYISKTEKDADGWADLLTLLSLGSALVLIGWFVANLIGWAPPVTEQMKRIALFFCGFWFVAKTIFCVIDYILIASTRFIFEILGYIGHALVSANAETEDSEPPTERDSSIAYLADFLRRKPPVVDQGEPEPPKAS